MNPRHGVSLNNSTHPYVNQSIIKLWWKTVDIYVTTIVRASRALILGILYVLSGSHVSERPLRQVSDFKGNHDLPTTNDAVS